MTPEQSRKLWGRSARGPERGRWIDTGNGNLAWANHPRPARTAVATVAVAPVAAPVSGKRSRKREMANV